MTRAHQKIEEKLYAECAISLLEKDWEIQEPCNEAEWPDLLVNDNNQIFGLEVRKLFVDEGERGSPQRNVESKWSKMLKKAAVNYYKNNSLSVRVQLWGDPGDPVKLSKKIAHSVKSLELWERKRIRIDDQRWMYICKLSNEFGEYKIWDVISNSVGLVGNIDPEIVQGAIDSKSAKLKKYKKHIAKVHLLLVCDRILNSGKSLFTNIEGLNTGGFECVYLLSFPDQLAQIKSKPATKRNVKESLCILIQFLGKYK